MAYKNKLGLSGIPQIPEMLPLKMGFFFSGKEDEFIHFSSLLDKWQLERKSIVDYVQDEEHKKALILDLDRLKKKAEQELLAEEKEEAEEQIHNCILRRKTFIKNAESEIARLQGWKPAPRLEREIMFRDFKVKVNCVFATSESMNSLISGTICIFEEGNFIIRQEIIETKQNRELAKVKVTRANTGQPIRLSFDTSGASRLAITEQRTGREESRPL